MNADPSSPGQAASQAALACNRFGFRILRKLAEKEPVRNIVISPASLALAMLMVHRGAGGDTRRAIAAALGLGRLDQDEIAEYSAALGRSLEAPDFGVELSVANALWVNTDLRLSPAFQNFVVRWYAAQARTIDFGDPHALEAINRWVSQATGGNIDPFLTEADLAPPTDCVLASAIYFKGLWSTPFDPKLTHGGTFSLPGRGRRSVPFMTRLGQYAYFETGTAQVVSLPYGSGHLSMEVLLPSTEIPLEQILLSMSPEEWENWMGQLQETRVELELPRFRLAYEAEMTAPLSALGMKIAFGPGADFSPMGLSGYFIGMVRHGARAEIDEMGTEAAAATAAGLIRTLSRPISMRVNRPFLCAIRDRRTGCLVFMGAVVCPA